MQQHSIRDTGLSISKLGLGAAAFGGEYGQFDTKELDHIFGRAVDAGINWVDTSPYYGRGASELALGQVLPAYRSGFVIATKAGRYDVNQFNFSEVRIRQSVEESLRRMKVDTIDILQLHDIEFADMSVIYNEGIPTLQALKREGKIKAFGVTGFALKMLTQVVKDFQPDLILNFCHLHLLNRLSERNLLPTCHSAQTTFINASLLCMGLLTHAGPPEWHMAPQLVKDAALRLRTWCAHRQLDLSYLALQYAFHYTEADCHILGIKSVKELEQSMDAFHKRPDHSLMLDLLHEAESGGNIDWIMGKLENN